MKMTKKLLALGMSVVMTMAMSATAFAASSTATVDATNASGVYSSTEITAQGSMNTPVVKVTVPTSSSFIINPYQLTATAPTDGDVAVTNPSAQIVSPEYKITSSSDTTVDLQVGVTVKGTVEGNLKLATASAAKATTNTVFLYLDARQDGDSYPAFKTTNTTQVVVGTAAKTQANLLTLKKNTSAYYKISGDASSKPATAWSDADKASVAITFTFTPLVKTADTTN
jgi:hypothetical protein